jgi:subtilisin family serine protease
VSPTPEVLVIGSDGKPFAGVPVTFAVGSGGGGLAAAVDTSNEQGIATPGTWTLGTSVGTNTLTAASGALATVTFTATASAGPPSAVAIASGNAQTGRVGAPVAAPLTVRVADAFGNPVPNVSVSFRVTSGDGQLLGTTVTSDALGLAAAGGWILGPVLGANTVAASVAQLPPVTFTATGIAGPAERLVVLTGDSQTGDIGVALATPLSVRVTDSFDNPVENVAVTFTVSSGNATVSAITATSSAQGIASTRVTLTAVGVTTITATSPAETAPGMRAVFSVSTGPTLVGQITIPQFPPRPFSGLRVRPRAATMKTASPSAQASPQRTTLTPEQAAQRVSTRGHLVISFRPDMLGLPRSAQAYVAGGTRQRAVDVYAAALAPRVQAGQIIERAISPAIGAVRVDVPAGQDVEAVMTDLRSDPRVLAVEEDGVAYALHLGGVEAARSSGDVLRRVRAPALGAAPGTEKYPNDPFFFQQLWNYNMINAPRAWARTTGNGQVRVAIVDTGIRPDHPAVGPLVSSTESFDFTDGATIAFSFPQPICDSPATFLTLRGTAAELALPRNIPQDPKQLVLEGDAATCWSLDPAGGHGTHIAGTVASPGNDNVGGAGVNWNVRLISVRALGVIGVGFIFDIAQGILYAGGLPATYTAAPFGFTVQTSPADIMNLSFGGAGQSTVLENAITAASANTLIIAAAGNSAGSAGSLIPAAYPQVLTVGALDPGYGLAWYTNVGSPIDFVAPGGDFRLGTSSGIFSSTFNYVTQEPNYSYYQGTSMAAPHVTGVAALVKAANPSLTAAQLRTRLEQSTLDLGPLGRDDRFGWGLLDAFRSVTGTTGPNGTATVRAVDASTGAVARSVAVTADGRFTFTNLAPGDYYLVAGQDEANDGLYGIPGRRFNWYGSPGMTTLSMSGTVVKSVAINLGVPTESEPNDDRAHAQPLVVNSWIAGNIGPPDVADVFSVTVPSAGVYTFETSGALGACGTALEVDTVLRLLDASGTQLAMNDDTESPSSTNPFGQASYPGRACSSISLQLQPGKYFAEVTGADGAAGTYRLHVRSGT